MKVLIIDASGVSLDFALRCEAHGHDVKVFIRNNKDGSRNENGDGGLITRVSNWEDHMNWADLVFCTDNVFYIHGLERYRNKGYPIVGPSVAGNRLEQERNHFDDVLTRMGIPTIPSQRFKNYDEAIKYVMDNPKRYVSKPLGDGEKSLSYVADNAADMVYMLQSWKKSNAYKGEFILQDFFKGTEVAVGGWFGPGGFNKQFCINFEHKKLMSNNYGVNTGEMGTVMYYTEDDPLVDKLLRPLEDFLHGVNYTGYFDIATIIGKNGDIHPLEATSRPGWPCFPIQMSLHKGDPVEWMLDLLEGKDSLKVHKKVATGVICATGDFPHNGLTNKECSGYPLFELTLEDAVTDVHLMDVKWGKAPALVDGEVKLNQEQFVTSGKYMCVVTGLGNTVEESADKAYNTLKKKIHIPSDLIVRDDIGERLECDLPELQSHGFCKDIKYA